MIGAFASLPHYWRHLAPIVAELRARGVEVHEVVGRNPRGIPRGCDVVLVASSIDARAFRGRERLVYVEHGAGQTYANARGEPGWPGGRGLESVACFIVPGPQAAAPWRAEYRAPVVEVGCPPLDELLARDTERSDASARAGRTRERNPSTRPGSGGPTVAFTFHWSCGVAPEAQPALPHYQAALPGLLRDLETRFQIVGHGHPRLWRRIERTWRQLGVEATPDIYEIYERADVLVADNTSVLYEFAALGRPVVCLNAPWYRRDVEHGLRFWSHVPGVQVDDPAELADAIDLAIADPPDLSELRSRAVDHVYAHLDGRAAARAADAIQEATLSPAYTRRETASEVESPLSHITRRLLALRATDEEVETFRQAWLNEDWTDADRAELLHCTDVELSAAIVEARTVNEFHETTEEEAAAKAADVEQAKVAEVARTEAWDARAQSIPAVLRWVGDDLARALAILTYEKAEPAPRGSLVAKLEKLLADAAAD